MGFLISLLGHKLPEDLSLGLPIHFHITEYLGQYLKYGR
jgi:hypothetical protein